MATTLANISSFVKAGASRIQYIGSSSGLPYSTAPSNGASVGMTRARGFRAANINFPGVNVVNIPGDDGVRAAIQFQDGVVPTFELVMADFDLDLDDTIAGTTQINAQTTYDVGFLNPNLDTYPDMFLVLTSRSPSKTVGKEGNGFANICFPLVTLTRTGIGNFSTAADDGGNTLQATVNPVSQTPWGEALTIATHGTTEVSGFIWWSQYPTTFDVYGQLSTNTDIAPTKAIASNEQVIAWNTITGTPSTLAVTYGDPTAAQFNFTASSDGDLTLFMYETSD